MGWQDIFGYYDFDDVYGAFVRDARPGFVFVEVGVFFGRSIAHLARMAIDAGKRGRIVAVDPWCADEERGIELEGWGDELRARAQAEGGPFNWFVLQMRTHAREELERIEVLRLPSVDAAGAFADGSVDAVWIDGDHRYEAVRADIAAWRPKIRPGGFIGGHDIAQIEDVQRAVREAFPNHETVRTSWRVRVPGPARVTDGAAAKPAGWLGRW